MEFSDYQTKADTTALYPDRGNNLVYPALGLTDEAGEVAGKLKKLMRDQQKFTVADLNDEDKKELAKELGDVLWYITAFAHEIGYGLDAIAQMNTEKLQSRLTRDKIGGSGDNR